MAYLGFEPWTAVAIAAPYLSYSMNLYNFIHLFSYPSSLYIFLLSLSFFVNFVNVNFFLQIHFSKDLLLFNYS